MTTILHPPINLKFLSDSDFCKLKGLESHLSKSIAVVMANALSPAGLTTPTLCIANYLARVISDTRRWSHFLYVLNCIVWISENDLSLSKTVIDRFQLLQKFWGHLCYGSERADHMLGKMMSTQCHSYEKHSFRVPY